MELGKVLRNSFITVSNVLGVTSCYRRACKKGGPFVRVICFHDVTDPVWFANVINHIKSRYAILSPDSFFAQRYDNSKNNILITFDDGYASWVDFVSPIFKENEIKGLFFVNSGLVHTYGDVDQQQAFVYQNLLLSSSRKTISWEGVASLSREGHTIGGHTESHIRLSGSEEKIQLSEIQNDKIHIEKNIQKNISAFAYPFGRISDYTELTKAVVAQAGYTHAFTTESGFVSHEAEGGTYAIPRTCIEEGLTLAQIDAWIDGGYDVYAKFKKVCAG